MSQLLSSSCFDVVFNRESVPRPSLQVEAGWCWGCDRGRTVGEMWDRLKRLSDVLLMTAWATVADIRPATMATPRSRPPPRGWCEAPLAFTPPHRRHSEEVATSETALEIREGRPRPFHRGVIRKHHHRGWHPLACHRVSRCLPPCQRHISRVQGRQGSHRYSMIQILSG